MYIGEVVIIGRMPQIVFSYAPCSCILGYLIYSSMQSGHTRLGPCLIHHNLF